MTQPFKIGQSFYPSRSLTEHKNVNSKQIETSNANFQSLFEQKLQSAQKQDLKFSMHAKQRLTNRGIELNPNMLNQLNEAVEKVAKKGSKDSLILLDQLAFVVNVPNRTVITAVDENSMKEHIFTNIDSTIIL